MNEEYNKIITSNIKGIFDVFEKEKKNKKEKKKEIALYPSKLSTISLPVRNPKKNFYERNNGRDYLIIESGSWINPITKQREETGIPYGIIPRHILMFLSHSYHIYKKSNNDPRVINFPITIYEFLTKLGYTAGGNTYKLIENQIIRLFNARIGIYKIEKDSYQKEENSFIEKYEIWNNYKSVVKISKMTEEILKKVRVLDLNIVRQIKQNCLEFDTYCWLTSRHYEITKPYLISWQKLHEQFGANYKNIYFFKVKIQTAFNNILKLYPHNSKLVEKGILLQNSKTSIAPKKQSEQKKLDQLKRENKKRLIEGQEWKKRQYEYNKKLKYFKPEQDTQ